MARIRSFLRSFLASRRGNFGPTAALVIALLVLAAGGGVELSNVYRARQILQEATDAATLAAARSYDKKRDMAAATALARAFLEKGVVQGYAFDGEPTITITLNTTTRITTAKISAAIKTSTSFLRLAGMSSLRAASSAEAEVGGYKDIYLVMMLDVTGSMSALITSAKAAMTSLEAQIRSELESRGKSFGKLYVKVAFVRDMRVDGTNAEPYAWRETRIFDMSQTAEQTALATEIGAQTANGGGDTPESTSAGIAYFLTAPFEAPLDPANTFQLITVWSDAPGLPLGPEDIDYATSRYTSDFEAALGDDKTVSLWKSLSSGTSILTTPESDYYSSASYGCCKTLYELQTKWRSGGTVPSSSRGMVIFADQGFYPWWEMDAWPNVETVGYTGSTPSGMINSLVDSLSDISINLRISR